jgi:hypothetical protein
MATPAPKRISLAEFLEWDDGTDMLYELIGPGIDLSRSANCPSTALEQSLHDIVQELGLGLRLIASHRAEVKPARRISPQLPFLPRRNCQHPMIRNRLFICR